MQSESKEIISQLREELSESYHRKVGAKTILYALNKYQESPNPGFRLPTAPSTINKILRELGYIIPKQKRLREPLILPPPMDFWGWDYALRQSKDTLIMQGHDCQWKRLDSFTIERGQMLCLGKVLLTKASPYPCHVVIYWEKGAKEP